MVALGVGEGDAGFETGFAEVGLQIEGTFGSEGVGKIGGHRDEEHVGGHRLGRGDCGAPGLGGVFSTREGELVAIVAQGFFAAEFFIHEIESGLNAEPGGRVACSGPGEAVGEFFVDAVREDGVVQPLLGIFRPEETAGAWNAVPFVEIGSIPVGGDFGDVERDLARRMCAVDEDRDVKAMAEEGDSFDREDETGAGGDVVDDDEFGFWRDRGFDAKEALNGAWVREREFGDYRFGSCCCDDLTDGALDGGVTTIGGEDFVTGVELEHVEDGGNGDGDIFGERDGAGLRAETPGDEVGGFAPFVVIFYFIGEEIVGRGFDAQEGVEARLHDFVRGNAIAAVIEVGDAFCEGVFFAGNRQGHERAPLNMHVL